MNARFGRLSGALALAWMSMGTAGAQTPFLSDDFNTCGGPAAYWTEVDPLECGTIGIHGAGTSDAQLSIHVAAGAGANPWNQNLAPRLVQASSDDDFVLQLKIDSRPTQKYQMAGALVEQDAQNWLCFEFYSDGNKLWNYTRATVGGVTAAVSKVLVAPGTTPLYVRVRREGHTWTHEFSGNGDVWAQSASFFLPMTVTAVGPFAGNSSPSPAFEARFDYFFDSASPIVPEDGNPAGGPLTLTASPIGAGSGSIQVTPSQATYACGDIVVLEAIPNPGSEFTGWSGALQGSGNPAQLLMQGNVEVFAQFSPTGPPVLSDLVVQPGPWGAVVTWTTNKPASSVVDYGITSSYGSQESSSALVNSHHIVLTDLDPATTYHLAVTSVDELGQAGSSGDLPFETLGTAGPLPDDFNHCGGVAGFWTVEDPLGGAVIATTGAGTQDAWLSIAVPAGVKRDPWDGSNLTTRIMQPSDDDDFELEVAFESVVSLAYQMQGLLVEEDALNWMRFDFYHTGSATKVFAARTVGGVSTTMHSATVPSGVALRMRVRRTGDSWSQTWSPDGGLSWNPAATFDHVTNVNRVGIFAGTAGSSPPAFTLEADYFWRTNQALQNEDGAPVGGPFSVVPFTVGPGAGSIAISPAGGPYNCGESLTLTANPGPGCVFAGWQGALAGQPNPAAITIGDDLDAIARFELAGPPVISDVQVSVQTTTATVTWTTDKLATSQVDYGTTPALGEQVLDSTLATEHSILIDGLDSGILHHFTVTSTDWSGQSTVSEPDTFTTAEFVGPFSDDFNRCSGLAEFWTVVDPVGGAVVSTEGAGTSQATIVVDLPAGQDRNAWGSIEATRLLQSASDEDFVVEVSFLNILTTAFQLQGLLVQQDDDNWLRFDFHSTGSQTRLFAAQTTGGQSVTAHSSQVTDGAPLAMRVARNGDAWTLSWSDDLGGNWNVATSFERPLQVQQVGLLAGVVGSSTSLRMEADYFINLGRPLAEEDGPIDTGPFTIEIPQDGSVIIDPPLASYACGQTVTITAVPAPGTIFSSWSGPFAGYPGSFAIQMGSDLVMNPVFAPTPAPVITPLPVAVGPTSALVAWQTDLPADSMVEYGLTEDYTDAVTESALVLNHQVPLFGLLPDTLYHYRITSASDGGLASSTPDGTFRTTLSGGSLSSDFNHPNIDTTRWSSFQDPLGGAELRIEGAGTADAHLVMEIAAGRVHEVWNRNDSARIVQLIDDVDLDVAVKMESVFDAAFQMQGIVFVGAEDDDFVRVELHHSGQGLYAFAATTVGGVPQQRIHTSVWNGPWTGDPLYLRVKRQGSTWTVYYSFDLDEALPAVETGWTSLGSFQHACNLTAVGPFVANEGGAPAHIARFDWFFDLLNPVPAEDQILEPDDLPPYMYRDTYVLLSPSSVEINWWTDEPATGYVRYGLTSEYELGQSVVQAYGYSQSLMLTQLEPDTTYHYQIVCDDGLQSTASADRVFTTSSIGSGGPGPMVELWYARQEPDGTYYQAFGQNGLTQKFCNILGNVSETNGPVSSLTYTLNGGPATGLSLGPDTRRLLRPGDFNVDLPIASLNEGLNTVVLRAIDVAQQLTEVMITVDFTASHIPPAGGVIDWDAVENINDVAQIVDGKWEIADGKLRAVEQGYDRLVTFGDYRWSDYEMTIPVTVHSIDPGGYLYPSHSPVVGFVIRWEGHQESGSQPMWKFWPMGALALYRWNELSPQGRSEMRGNANSSFVHASYFLDFDVEHTLKARVTTNPNGSTDYKFKIWISGQPEPGWIHQFTLPAGDPNDPSSNPENGSIGILSHHTDADYGDVILQRLDPF